MTVETWVAGVWIPAFAGMTVLGLRGKLSKSAGGISNEATSRILQRGVQVARRRVHPRRPGPRRTAGGGAAVPRLHRRQGPVPARQRPGAERGGLRGDDLRLQGLGAERGRLPAAAGSPQPGLRRAGGHDLPRRAAGGGRGAHRHLRHQLRRSHRRLDRRHRPARQVRGQRGGHRQWYSLDEPRPPHGRVVRPPRPLQGRPHPARDDRQVRDGGARRNPAARPPVRRPRRGPAGQQPQRRDDHPRRVH